MEASSDASSSSVGDSGSRARQPLTNPGAQAGPGLTTRQLLWLLNNDPVTRAAVLSLVSREMGLHVKGVEGRVGAQMEQLARSVKSNVTETVGAAIVALGDTSQRAASSVARYLRSFKLVTLAAVFILFCAVAYLCVEHVRGATVRADERDTMHELLDEARMSVLEVAGAREEIATHGRAITGLLDESGRNTAFRQSYEAFDFPVQIDDIQTQLGVLQLEVATLREDTHAQLRANRRDTREIAHRVAPVEAVVLTNRTRYYRGPLDEMAGTRCSEATRGARRASPDFHVRACTDGFNGQEYLLWCAQEHRGKPPELQFSGCTSTNPYHHNS